MSFPWTFDPAVVVFCLLLPGGYWYATGPLRERHALGEAPSLGRRLCFAAGWLTLVLTVVTPLDYIGRFYLLTAHTLQLVLITTVAAPLLMLGMPEWLSWLLLPRRALRNATRGLGFALVAVLGFNGLVLIWQVNTFFDAAQRSMPVHDLQNLTYLVAGILTWWPLLTPLDRQSRMRNPVQMLYLVLESLPLDIFGVAELFIQRVFYPIYATAPRLLGLSVLVDQQVSGAILAVPGNIVDMALMSVVFFKWIEQVERAQNQRERAEAEAELAAVEAQRRDGERATAEAPRPGVDAAQG